MSRFIAFYLPQFHPIPENDEWWGKGFTEWTNVAKARRLFPGHKEPHIPADLGFYDLRLPEVREAQAQLAREAGIEGFCYWHYWFGNGRRLLERPFNEVVASGKPDFPFCLAWANHSWKKKQWDPDAPGKDIMLMEQLYPGEEDYINHFNTLFPAFKDKRYIRVNGKLLFIIYDPVGSPDIPHIMKLWRNLAEKNGLGDFYFVATDADSRCKERNLKLGFDAIYNSDVFNIHHHTNIIFKVFYMICRKYLKIPTIFRYKKAIKYMINADCKSRTTIPCIAPNWDHSPRSGANAIILHNPKPEYFKEVIKIAMNAVKDKPKEEQLIFIKSWNEWGEGNYMEPDLEYGKGYLNALQSAIEEDKIFYRLLFEETINFWNEKKYTSSHSQPPGDWIELAKKGCFDKRKYNLLANGLKRPEEALDAYLSAVGQHGVDATFLVPELIKCGLYEGVSAYDDYTGVLQHAFMDFDLKGIVIFKGKVNGSLNAEEGGWAVYPKEVIKEFIYNDPLQIKDEFLNWVVNKYSLEERPQFIGDRRENITSKN